MGNNHKSAAGILEETVSAKDLSVIEGFYDQSQLLKAWAIIQQYPAISTWKGKRSLEWAARLVSFWGTRRMSWMLTRRMWRQYSHTAAAASLMAYGIYERRGPFAAFEFLNVLNTDALEGSLEEKGYLWGAYVVTFSEFRDFDASEKYFEKVQKDGKDTCWQWVVESWLREKQDRYEAALDAAQHAILINPTSRSALQQTGHLLQLCGRTGDARDLLESAAVKTECGHIMSQLALLQIEMEDYPAALESLERYLAYSPLAEPSCRAWADQQRIKIACRMGDYSFAVNLCKTQSHSGYQNLVKRLELPNVVAQIRRLPVKFVRQHHLTCAPATVTALAQYWNVTINHLDLAEEICYDGTPSHSTRRWLTNQGLIAVEFNVTWETAVKLIDAGIPFAITTQEATSSHLQAVIGYDELRQTMLIRDPFYYTTGEATCPEFLERYAADGPLGLLVLPQQEHYRLDGIILEDVELYDLLHKVECALHRHHRDEAQKTCEQMMARGAEHRLAISAAWAIAAYDSNSIQGAAQVNALLKLFPKNDFLSLTKYRYMRELVLREERLDFLKAKVKEKLSHPIFSLYLGQELLADARQLKQAERYARNYLRVNPSDADGLNNLANVVWARGDFSKSLAIYRLAACLAERREEYSRTYFKAAYSLRGTDEALKFLHNRFVKFKQRSAGPAMTLFNALCQIRQDKHGFEILDEEYKLRTDDGDLLVFLADAHARRNNTAKAEEFLVLAEGRCSRSQLCRTTATIAAYRADRRKALECWKNVLALEPLAIDAHRETAWLLAETEGTPIASRHLEETCLRFPQNVPLMRLRIEFLIQLHEPEVQTAITQLLQTHPLDTFILRELTLLLAGSGKFDEAILHANRAIDLEPDNSFSFSTRAEVLLRRGEVQAAQADLKTAVQKSIENGYAVTNLVSICETVEKRAATIQFLQSELRRQVVFEVALFAFRDAVLGLLKPEELLAQLEEAYQARPDLWTTGIVLGIQLKAMGRLEESYTLINKTCERFPLVPRVWLEKGLVLQVMLQMEQAVTAFEQTIAMSPQYVQAIHELAEVLEKLGNYDKARLVLEDGITQVPLNHTLHGHLAEILWKLDHRADAITRLQHAIRLNASFEAGWNFLRAWGHDIGHKNLALETARELVSKNPGNYKTWMLLAENLMELRDVEALNAVNRAIQLNPWAEFAFDLKARILATQNRLDEAISCCHPTNFGITPATLRLREAWLEAQRGKLHEAIKKINDFLTENPANYAGWKLLAEWHCSLKNIALAEQATKRMVELAPQDPQTLSFAGNMALENQDPDHAKELFERAFNLAPNYSYAGMQLFDLLLENHQFDEASRVLQILKKHGQNDYLLVRDLQFAIKVGPQTSAYHLFPQLCLYQSNSEWPLFTGANLLVSAKQAAFVFKTVEMNLSSDKANPFLGSLWVKMRFDKKVFSPGKLFDTISARGQLGRNAVAKYINMLAGVFRESPNDIWVSLRVKSFLRHIAKKHRKFLFEKDLFWGSMGYALLTIGDYPATAEWLSDWRSRKQVEPWMLYNLAFALEMLGRPAEVLAPLREAINQRQDAALFYSVSVLLAFEEAVNGNQQIAKTFFQHIPEDQIAGIDRPLFGFTKSLLLALETYPDKRQELKKQLKYELKCALGGVGLSQHSKFVRKTYLRCLKKLGMTCNIKSFLLYYYFAWGWDNWAKYLFFTLLLCGGPLGWILILVLYNRNK